jgi:glucosamine--fructose-6-phosphate aminotransferase (isomerizing)
MPARVETRLWSETRRVPVTIARTLERAEGFDDAVAVLRGRGARRIVATGNGAAFYVAHALWLASLSGPQLVGREHPLELLAVPAGVLAGGRFGWREGDRLLVVSSSGELRDAIEALAAGVPRPYVAITSSPESTIARGAEACALVEVESQEATTHTQAYCGNVAAALALLARLASDETLARALADSPQAVEAACERAGTWADEAARFERPRAAVVFGSGVGWAAALEAALLLKEVAAVPAEGVETREGATSGMYALGEGQVALSLPAGDDALLAEAEETCARSGATTLRAPGGDLADPRLAPLTTFPAAVALAAELGLAAGLDVDRPHWLDAYLATARVAGTQSTP